MNLPVMTVFSLGWVLPIQEIIAPSPRSSSCGMAPTLSFLQRERCVPAHEEFWNHKAAPRATRRMNHFWGAAGSPCLDFWVVWFGSLLAQGAQLLFISS